MVNIEEKVRYIRLFFITEKNSWRKFICGTQSFKNFNKFLIEKNDCFGTEIDRAGMWSIVDSTHASISRRNTWSAKVVYPDFVPQCECSAHSADSALQPYIAFEGVISKGCCPFCNSIFPLKCSRNQLSNEPGHLVYLNNAYKLLSRIEHDGVQSFKTVKNYLFICGITYLVIYIYIYVFTLFIYYIFILYKVNM